MFIKSILNKPYKHIIRGEIVMKYVCTICGYVYDDQVETVKFEDLPDTWVCPTCGVSKDMLQKVEEQFLHK